MVKKMRESINQPVRHSHRTRVLNIRLGTPPKILLDMLKDHSSCAVKTLPAVADVERVGKYNTSGIRLPFLEEFTSCLFFSFFGISIS